MLSSSLSLYLNLELLSPSKILFFSKETKLDFINRIDFIEKWGKYLSMPGVKESFELHDAYFKGKSAFFKSLVEKYKNNFKNFKTNKPIEAREDFNENDAGLFYNRTDAPKDFNYEDEKSFHEVIEMWEEYVADGLPGGDRMWDWGVQKNNLGKEADARWERHQEGKKWFQEHEANK